MRLVQFPPLCPFGSEDDAALIESPGSRYYIMPIAEKDIFVRICIHEGGEVAYNIAEQVEISDLMHDAVAGLEDVFRVDKTSRERLRKWGFCSLLGRIIYNNT
jgi:hypothetical protein